jgi:hypothetical protein
MMVIVCPMFSVPELLEKPLRLDFELFPTRFHRPNLPKAKRGRLQQAYPVNPTKRSNLTNRQSLLVAERPDFFLFLDWLRRGDSADQRA